MKILTLIIKQKWFDEIMSGKKTTEYRELTPNNARKLVEIDSNGYFVENAELYPEGEPTPKHYDAIRFYVGYNKDRDTALVKVNSEKAKFIRTETGEIIYDGEPNSDDFWPYVTIEYYLGEIIEKKHTHGKSK